MDEENKIKIKAVIVLEMIGRPAEHLKEVMPKLIETIGKEKGIKIASSSINEPKKFENKDAEGKVIEMPENQVLYTTFSEVELEADDVFDLIRVCFNYMPSNIEIIQPEEVKFRNIDLSSLLTGLLSKLHNYDSLAKSALMENQVLARELAKFVKPKVKIEPVNPEETESKEAKAGKPAEKKPKKAKNN